MRSLLLSMAFVLASLACVTPATAAVARPAKALIFVGTYSGGGSKGIYTLEFDYQTATLKLKSTNDRPKNPSFLALHPSGKYLYAVNEITRYKNQASGSIQAYAIDKSSGSLRYLNTQTSNGGAPCHIVVDKSGSCVLAANYVGGSVIAIPIKPDGSLAKPGSTIQHKGSSVNPRRQKAPHAHSINVDKSGRFAVAADLGIDKLLIYKLNPKTGKLTANNPAFAKVKPGAGPRHFAFHPTNKFAYVINELHSTITAFNFDSKKGALNPIQTITTMPADHKRGNSTAQILVHPSGRFVYGSNRGHDSIVAYSVNPKSGKLNYISHTKTEGKTPRNFNIDPSGRFLFAANQNSGNIVIFHLSKKNGRLHPAGQEIRIPRPVCIQFLITSWHTSAKPSP